MTVGEDYADLMNNDRDPDRNIEYKSKYCTFEMSEKDLKQIKINKELTVPLSDYLTRNEEYEIDYNKC